MLDNMKSIALAVAGEPRDIGMVRIAAGEDPKEISRWVQLQEMAKAAKSAEDKVRAKHGD